MGKPGLALACVSGVVALGAFDRIAAQEMGSVLGEQEIAFATGGFGGTLDADDHFGHAVTGIGDLDGDGVLDLAVGAPDDDDGGNNRGAVWILFLERTGQVRAQAKISSTQGGLPAPLRNGDRFGAALASLGDLDGDGRAELAVGVELDDDGGNNRGAVWILSLQPNGLVGTGRKISHTSGFAVLRDNDRFGTALATLDDLDGDGRKELAVGASMDRDGGTARGAVWVLFLDANFAVRTRAKISSTSGGFAGPLDNNDQFGSSVARVRDLDGDGVCELAVGALLDDDGGTDSGAAYVLFLRADATVRAQAKVSASSGLALSIFDHFGQSLASPGDLDGDEVDDLVVGCALDDDGGLNCGAAWVLFLQSNGSLKSFLKLSAMGGGLREMPTANDLFGSGLAALGDLDGDRKLDLAVGVEGEDAGRGACRVLFLESVVPTTLVVRNGLGVNPLILSAEDDPMLGAPWELTVDCTGFHRGVIMHLMVDRPFEGPVRGHQGQLLIDWRRPRSGFAFALVKHTGAVRHFTERIPADPALLGLQFFSQAFVTGRGGSHFTNALDGEFQPNPDPQALKPKRGGRNGKPRH